MVGRGRKAVHRVLLRRERELLERLKKDTTFLLFENFLQLYNVI